jgi:phosphoribosylformylglycinamidine synthase PurS subunit
VKFRVLVRLKPGILDVQGAAVKRALGGLGFHEVTDLRIGKLIEFDVDGAPGPEARARAEEMCRKLLTNPILEDYTIELADASDLAATERRR